MHAMECLVKSSARSLYVLDYFRRHGRPARASEIGQELATAPSTTNDLLKTMVEVGYLSFDKAQKTYFVAARAGLFGQWAASVFPDLDRATEAAWALQRASGETVVLSAQRGHRIQFLSVIVGSERPSPRVAEGLSAPVIGTAAGGAILMGKNDAELREIIKQASKFKAIDMMVARLSERIAAFKASGYATPLEDDFVPGNWTMAMPVPSATAGTALALGVGGQKGRIKSKEADIARLFQQTMDRYYH
jgi:DNA-binding IclR family transcriptional regulator